MRHNEEDLTPRRNSRAAAREWLGLELSNTLEATRLCRVHTAQARGGDIRLLFTVPADKTAAWHAVVVQVLATLEQSLHDVAIGQVCMLSKGRLVAPWQLRVVADDIAELEIAVMAVRKAFLRVLNPDVDRPHPRTYDSVYGAFDRADAVARKYQTVGDNPPARGMRLATRHNTQQTSGDPAKDDDV